MSQQGTGETHRREVFNRHHGRLAISAVTLAELLHGAAHTRREGLTLVSNNLREFERVEGLLTENWLVS